MTEEDYWAQVRRQGYQQALNDMADRLDWLSENSEDMNWHRGVEAARCQLNALDWDEQERRK